MVNASFGKWGIKISTYIRLIPHVFGCMAQVRGAQSLHSWGTSDQEKKEGIKIVMTTIELKNVYYKKVYIYIYMRII